MCVQHADALHMKWELFWPEVSGGGLAWRRKHASRKKKNGITLLFSKNVQVNLVKCIFPSCRKTFPCFFGLCLPVGWLREIALRRAGGFHCQPLLGWVRAACTWFLCMQKQECLEDPPWHFQLQSTVHHESFDTAFGCKYRALSMLLLQLWAGQEMLFLDCKACHK